MIGWLIGAFLLVPLAAAGYTVARAKPAPPIRCGQCRDGESLFELPVAARKGFRLALRCPGCGALYGSKISEMSLKRMTEEQLLREFPDPEHRLS